jgi:hypothetical protein
MVDSLELQHLESEIDFFEHQPVDEQTLRSIQRNYQSDHQEEFLRLKAQVETLLSELRKFAPQSDEAEFTI